VKLLVDGQTLATPEIDRGIGVVFKRLCEHLVPAAAGIEWYMAVRAEDDLRHFSPQVRALVKPVLMGRVLEQDGQERQTAAYTDLLHKAARRHQLDAYWTPNPLMHHVLLPTELSGLTVFATIYDLIPLVLRAECLDTWPEHVRREYLRRVQRLPVWADRLVFISEHSRRDYEQFDSRVSPRADVVPLAVDHARFWPHTAPSPAREPYVLYIGGFECPRKNMARALEAFALLVRSAPAAWQRLAFYVVCGYNARQREAFLQRAKQLGVGERVRLTGYVDDDTLAELYRQAAVFFFPTLYEGFGLPVLEAMACGVPVVATRVSSLPEVAGDVAYYCSATDPHDMARLLLQALQERDGPSSRRAAVLARAREFRWERTAAAYARLFTAAMRSRLHSVHGPKRPRIAHVVAALPRPLGLFGHSADVVSCLAVNADVTIYVPQPMGRRSLADLEVKPLSELPADLEQFDAAVYQIDGDGPHDACVRTLAQKYPGIILLPELKLSPLATAQPHTHASSQACSSSSEHRTSSGLAGRPFGPSANDCTIWESAWALAGCSHAILVGSQWARGQLPVFDNVFVVPHVQVPIAPPEARAELEFRQRFGLRPEQFVLGAFGKVNAERLDLLLRAVRALGQQGYPVRLLLDAGWGDAAGHACLADLAADGARSVVCTGGLDAEMLATAISVCDVVLHVRCPSAGALPLPLAAALSLGKACLVSNERQFAELPDSVCWKVDRGAFELQQLVAYVQTLLGQPAVRRQLETNARFFTATYATCQAAAERYLDVVRLVSAAGGCREAA